MLLIAYCLGAFLFQQTIENWEAKIRGRKIKDMNPDTMFFAIMFGVLIWVLIHGNDVDWHWWKTCNHKI